VARRYFLCHVKRRKASAICMRRTAAIIICTHRQNLLPTHLGGAKGQCSTYTRSINMSCVMAAGAHDATVHSERCHAMRCTVCAVKTCCLESIIQ